MPYLTWPSFKKAHIINISMYDHDENKINLPQKQVFGVYG